MDIILILCDYASDMAPTDPYSEGPIAFAELTIQLPSRPLIPRVETEFWVDAILKAHLGSLPRNAHILDLCAGSGCIGLLAAQRVPWAEVDLVELEESHHTTIRINAEENAIPLERLHIFGGDLFSQIDSRRYDLILSNPPYIDPALDRTAESVRMFEPHAALYGGTSGVELIDRIIAALPVHLTEHGTAYIEHEPEQTAHIHTYATQHGLHAETYRDQYGVERYTKIIQ